MKALIILGIIFASVMTAQETEVLTHWTKTNAWEPFNYTLEAGEESLSDAEGNEKAAIFYVAYFKEGNHVDRPITFCFNGGPGSSAIWLHMGAFGPKTVGVAMNGNNSPPYQIKDNPSTLLDLTDLVFIDPVSTGFSRLKKEEDAKQYHGVDEDIKLMSEFVRQFVTNKGRWNSPKFLAGESYGAARVIGIADHLEEKARLYFNGLLLISAATNISLLRTGQPGNDLPYALFIPTYTATAFYHKKLPGYATLDAALSDAQEFASGPYITALMKGDQISSDEKSQVAKSLSKLTGLAQDWIISSNIRVSPQRFGKELLKKEGRIIGRFDSRMEGGSTDLQGSVMEFDYSQEAIFPSFVAGFNQYMRDELGWKKSDEYRFMSNVQPWNYCRNSQDPMNMSQELRELIIRNRGVHVFFALGLYDLATPFFGQQYVINHLGLNSEERKNISVHTYPAGHMMYIDDSSMKQLKTDLSAFYKRALGSGSL